MDGKSDSQLWWWEGALLRLMYDGKWDFSEWVVLLSEVLESGPELAKSLEIPVASAV